jgi:peptidoglycan hydrolase-like protein with peptidoglycan-binding domain
MKKVIRMTESQLKKMVEQTVNQEDNQFFKLIINQWGDNVKTNRSGKGKEIILSNGDKVWFYSSGDCYYITKDEKAVTAGEIVPSGTTDFKLVFEDGDSYDSVTEKWTEKAPQTPKPCANKIIDITNGSLLKFGCKTQGVKELQTLLDFKNPTGYFGKITKQKVTDFQKKNSLKKVDGVVGPETYKALTPNAIPPPAQDVTEDEDIAMLDNLFSKD